MLDLTLPLHLPQLPPAVAELEVDARAFAAAATSPATRRRYAAAWRLFSWFAGAIAAPALPSSAHTVALYVTWLARAGRSKATITVHLAAIRAAHQLAGYGAPLDDPTLRTVWRGVRRSIGRARAPKRAARLPEILRMLDACDEDAFLTRYRNRALILLGFAGGRRRGELAGLDVVDLAVVDQGLTLHVSRSKTDQESRGLSIGIPYGRSPSRCPVRAWRDWLDARDTRGIGRALASPAFLAIDRHDRAGGRLSAEAVGAIVQRLAERCGLPAAEFGGHSLRSGFCTEAAANGAADRAIMRQTGHTSRATLDGYVHSATLFDPDNAAGKLGL